MLWRATEISQPPKSLRPPSMAEDEQDGAWAHEIAPTLLPRSLRDHVDRIRYSHHPDLSEFTMPACRFVCDLYCVIFALSHHGITAVLTSPRSQAPYFSS
jgi:hypothetical protein